MAKNTAALPLAMIFLAVAMTCLNGCGSANKSEIQNSAAQTDAALTDTAARGHEGVAPDIVLDNSEPPPLDIYNPLVSEAGRAAMTPWPAPPGGTGGWSADTAASSSITRAFDGDYASLWIGANGPSEWDVFYSFANSRDLDRISVNYYSSSYMPASTTVSFSDNGTDWFATATMNSATFWDVYYATSSVSAKYVWIHMQGIPAANWPAIREIDWEPVADNDAAYARPGYNHSTYFPSSMYDGNANTVWTGAIGAGEWNVYYKFSTLTDLKMVTAAMYNDANHPATMTLYTSTDGVSWSSIGTMEHASNTMQYAGVSANYLKINMQDPGGGYYPYIKDITWNSMPPGGSSGDSINQTYIGANAFDDNPNTWWAGDTTLSSWDLFYNYGSSQDVGSVMLYYYAANYVPGTTTVYCSSDAMTWVEKDSVTSGQCPVLDVDASCQYLKFHMDGKPTVGYPIIKDVEIGDWVEVGAGCASGDGISEGYGMFTALDTDPSNNVYMAHLKQNASTKFDLYVKKWGCPNWTDVGGSPVMTDVTPFDDYSIPIDIESDASNRIFVAWQQVAGGPRVYAKEWDGYSWNELAGSASNDGLAGVATASIMPSVAYYGTSPMVGYVHGPSGINGTYVKYYNGSSWVGLGGSDMGTGLSSTGKGGAPVVAEVATTTGSYPIAVWSDKYFGINQIYVKRYDVFLSRWVEMGTNSASQGGISNSTTGASYQDLVVKDYDEIYVVWVDDYEVFVCDWDGSSWSSPTQISNSSGYVWRPGIALNSSGFPIVVWSDSDSGDYEIYVKEYNGTSWDYIGTDSAINGGISDSSTAARIPAITTLTNGKPIISWNETDSSYPPWGYNYVKQYIK